jgi:hypothetical protein
MTLAICAIFDEKARLERDGGGDPETLKITYDVEQTLKKELRDVPPSLHGQKLLGMRVECVPVDALDAPGFQIILRQRP